MYNLLNFKIQNLEKEFQTNITEGLTDLQASEKLKTYGKNTLESSFKGVFSLFLSQFNIFVFLLIFASLFSFSQGEYLDFYLLLAFALIDILLGFYQELKSYNVLSTLNRYHKPECFVIRNGQEMEISKDDLVPGDIVLLKSGSIVPADIKIIKSNNLLVDESSLTGDSNPISKNSQEGFDDLILYSGSSIISGNVTGIVVYTGKNSRIGHLNKLSKKLDSLTTYQIETKKLSELIFKIVAVSLTIVTLINYFYKFETFTMFLIYAISLAVTVIPEALPLIITFSLSSGAMKLYKNKVIVKKLSAIEDLGGIEVLCTDKTGTLTENKLVFSSDISLGTFDFEKIKFLSINSLHYKDPFDIALKENVQIELKAKILDEIVFDPIRKRSATLVEYNDKRYLVVKGAFEILNSFDHITQNEREKLINFNNEESKKGKRVLLFGYKELDKDRIYPNDEIDLKLEGAVSFEDVIKFSTFHSIKKAQELDIQVKVLTGDSFETSYFVAEKLGILSGRGEIISSEELKKLSGDLLHEAIFKGKVFCRLTPEEKVRVIKVLQSKYMVGYLGEGINDAPALKLANVGVAAWNSTEIARDSSDIILMKKSLDHLIEGIIEGRKIFQNISKYIKITISANFGNFFALLVSSFFVPFLPLLPVQILLIHILSDVPLMFVSTDNVDPAELSEPSKSDFNSLLKLTLILGGVSSIFDFAIFGYFRDFGAPTLHATWFLASILTEILIIYSLRTKKPFFKSVRPSFSLVFSSLLILLLTYLFLTNSSLMGIFHFYQIDTISYLIVIFLCIFYFLLSEAAKLLFYRSK